MEFYFIFIFFTTQHGSFFFWDVKTIRFEIQKLILMMKFHTKKKCLEGKPKIFLVDDFGLDFSALRTAKPDRHFFPGEAAVDFWLKIL